MMKSPDPEPVGPLNVRKIGYPVEVQLDDDGTPMVLGERLVEVRPGEWMTPLGAALSTDAFPDQEPAAMEHDAVEAATERAGEPAFRLYSSGLLSKWGFGDGDMPDIVCDHLGEDLWVSVDWHAALRLLVRRHLLPVLEQQVEVYDIETIHNPIRASRVDGRDIDDYADNDDVELTPDHVELSWAQVEAVLLEVSDGHDS